MRPAPQVLVVVISYNNVHHTVKAAESAAAQTVLTNVVVWDNASTDTSAERLAAYKWPKNVELHLSPENLLWSPGVNRAIREYWVDEPLICFMNNDITIPPTCFERLLDDVFTPHPDAGLAAPMGWGIGGPQDFAAHLAAFGGPETAFRAHPPYRVPYLIGCCMVVPSDVWQSVGELDEAMPLGADDHDYSIRVKDAGRSLWVHPGVVANHAGHATASSPEWEKWGGKSWSVFNAKWAGYFATEDEATNCHWGGVYVPGFDRGTGWDK